MGVAATFSTDGLELVASMSRVVMAPATWVASGCSANNWSTTVEGRSSDPLAASIV